MTSHQGQGVRAPVVDDRIVWTHSIVGPLDKWGVTVPFTCWRCGCCDLADDGRCAMHCDCWGCR